MKRRRTFATALRAALGALALALLPLWGGPTPTVEARFDPLRTIAQQITKANILVMLDTSGSMVGVPGGSFSSSIEVGTDCDRGDRCRGVKQSAVCSNNPAVFCTADSDCRTSGQCSLDAEPCRADSDCIQGFGACQIGGASCKYNSDCAPQFGICPDGSQCTSAQPCAQAGAACQLSGVACGSCTAQICSGTNTACTAHSNCNGANAITNGLMAEWRLNSSNFLADSSSNSKPLAVIGSYTPVGRNDRFGNATDALDRPSTVSLTQWLEEGSTTYWNGISRTSGITLAAWVNLYGLNERMPSGYAGPGWISLVSRRSTSTNNFYIWNLAFKNPFICLIGKSNTASSNLQACVSTNFNNMQETNTLTNLAANPGFESGTTGWVAPATGGWTHSTQTARSGAYGAFLSGGDVYASRPLTGLSVGTNYTCVAYVNVSKKKSADSPGWHEVQLRASEHIDLGSSLSGALMPAIEDTNVGWQQLSVQFAATQTTIHVGIKHWGFNGDSSLDDLLCYTTSSYSGLFTYNWYHVAATWENGYAKIYLNGKLRGTIPMDLALPTSGGGQVVLGGSKRYDIASEMAEALPGALDDVMIYNRALTGLEIARIARFCSGVNANNTGSFANVCIGGSGNACSVQPNVCQIATTNYCVGSSPTATCNVVNNTVTGLKMCEISLKPCVVNADCPTAGDRCVASSSRMSIAKRALTSVLMRNKDLANFGLMTFYQAGYYPYYRALSLPGTITETAYLPAAQLAYYGCFNSNGSPKSPCVGGGRTYTLVGTNNSRFRVRTGTNTYQYADQNYSSACGYTCNTSLGTGVYEGSYYTYSAVTGTYDPFSPPVVRPSYQGQQILVDVNGTGVDHLYFSPRSDYYSNPMNGVNRPPISPPVNCSTGSSCSATCGARWDTDLAPFMLNTTTNPTTGDTDNTSVIAAKLDKARFGGLMAWGNTPVGCTLLNNNEQTANRSAYHYMSQVKLTDPLSSLLGPDGVNPCRVNYVIAVTDGEANGPGDSGSTTNGCPSNQCNVTINPSLAGCNCRSVLAARALNTGVGAGVLGVPGYSGLGVKTIAIAFGADVTSGNGKKTNDNIARAGGTEQAFLATSEHGLTIALQSAILKAIQGSYATSPPTLTQGTQLQGGVELGTKVLEARVDYPEWRGRLRLEKPGAPDDPDNWDAGKPFDPTSAQYNPNYWKTRKIYTWNPTASPTTSLVKLTPDPSTGDLPSGTLTTLQTIMSGDGLTITTATINQMMRWAMGDPALGNPAVLGAFINSTPIDVGPPGIPQLAGGKAFNERYKDRPNLIYAGASDGMLHAFFTRNTTIGSYSYQGGEEAFAFIPPDMLKVIARLYTQGGQLPSPADHVYGLASSPKVKNICSTNCTDDSAYPNNTAGWKTVLVMGQGPGGNGMFVLDITNPFDASGALKPQPFPVVWHSKYGASASTYASALGQTFSVPAFYYNRTAAQNDYRLLYTSGYGVAPQGTSLVTTQISPAPAGTPPSAPPTVTSVTSANGCAAPTFPQPYTLLTDVATARNYDSAEQLQLLGAYFGDTWGQLWRMSNGVLSSVVNMGCAHPMHFSPAVVQIDSAVNGTPLAGYVYLVQVTNSSLDLDTRNFASSQLIVRRDIRTGPSTAAADSAFGTLSYTVGGTPSCTGTPCDPIPADVRPLSTPRVVLRKDGTGFRIFTPWYRPATCKLGKSFLTVHEVTGNNLATYSSAAIADEPIGGVVVVGGGLYMVTSKGIQVVPGFAPPDGGGGGAGGAGGAGGSNGGFVGSGAGSGDYRVLTWTELP